MAHTSGQNMRVYICIYISTYLNTYIHTIHTHIHTYIHTDEPVEPEEVDWVVSHADVLANGTITKPELAFAISLWLVAIVCLYVCAHLCAHRRYKK
jgi:hypothetical protein